MDFRKPQGRSAEAGGTAPAARGRIALGRAAEAAAEAHLTAQGFGIASRNWRCKLGELDLVAEDGGTVVFVEVRSRSRPTRFGTAVEAVTPAKCRQVRAVAEAYLRMKGLAERPVRFDVVAVTFGADGAVAELKHLRGAF